MKNANNLIEEYGNDRKDFMTTVKEAVGMNELEVKFKKLDKNAVIPIYAHDGDMGMDMTAISVEYDSTNDMYIYHTGLAFETDKHYGILLFPRSSNRKTDAYLCNHVGIVDSAIYRGEIMFCYKNRTSLETRAEIGRMRLFLSAIVATPFTTSESDGRLSFNWCDAAKNSMGESYYIYDNPMNFAPYKVGDRIGQMVVIPYPQVKLKEMDELSETERGSGGFGSTGK